MPQLPRRAARPAPKASARDVDEARAARLARFSDEGAAQNQAAFEAALASAAPSAPSTTAASKASAPAEKPRMATLGTIAQRDGGDDPDEFFGGDSTAQYK